MDLRAARPDDLPAVEALLAAQRLPRAGLSAAFRDFIVAADHDDLIGSIGFERHERHGLLRSAAVRDDWKGKGIGALLVQRLLETAKACGLTDLYLLTTTAADWFPRFGFRVIPRDAVPEPVRASVEFTSACPESATVMVRELA